MSSAADIDSKSFTEKLAVELQDEKLARLYTFAGELCAEGDCENGHRLFRKIIAEHPDSILSLQCQNAILMCCADAGETTETDEARRALIAAGERMIAEHPRARWVCDVCCLVAGTCLRVREPAPEYLAKAENTLRICKSMDNPAPHWQCADIEGQIHERREEWSDAIRVYRRILPEVDTPRKWYFQVRLSESLIGQANQLSRQQYGSGLAAAGPVIADTVTALRECARAILESITRDTSIDIAYRNLASRSLETLYGERVQHAGGLDGEKRDVQ